MKEKVLKWIVSRELSIPACLSDFTYLSAKSEIQMENSLLKDIKWIFDTPWRIYAHKPSR